MKGVLQYTKFILISVTLLVLYAGVTYLFARLSAEDAIRSRQTPREYLFAQCEIQGCDAELMDAIATCESRWIMVQNKISSAHGYFQILDSTEATTPQYQEGLRKFDPYVNVDMAIWLFNRWGSSPWNESKGCWANRYQIDRATPATKSIGVRPV